MGIAARLAFTPERYGAAGTGLVDDTAAVQAAIDAASVRGGVVKLVNTYLLTKTGSITHLGQYETSYALWLNANYVDIEGPGTLKLATVPNSTKFSMLVIGNGGNSTGGAPGPDGTWTKSVGVHGVTFDATVLTRTQRRALDAMVSGMALFAYCRYWTIEDCSLLGAWGWVSIACSQRGSILRNTITNCADGAIVCDGPQYVTVSDNVATDVGGSGIIMQANLDNGVTGVARYNTIEDNSIGNWGAAGFGGTGMQLVGCSDSLFNRNVLTCNFAGPTGLLIRAYATATGKATGSGNTGTGNSFTKPPGTAGTCVNIYGITENAYDGLPLAANDNQVLDTTKGSYWLNVFTEGVEAANNTVEFSG